MTNCCTLTAERTIESQVTVILALRLWAQLWQCWSNSEQSLQEAFEGSGFKHIQVFSLNSYPQKHTSGWGVGCSHLMEYFIFKIYFEYVCLQALSCSVFRTPLGLNEIFMIRCVYSSWNSSFVCSDWLHWSLVSALQADFQKKPYIAKIITL